MILDGLTDFQKALVSTERNLEKAMREGIRTQGNKATKHVRKKAKSEVGKVTGNYHKKFKRGKVFIGHDGAITTRVLNTSPHGHLIEDNRRQVTKDGRVVGVVQGRKILQKGMAEFEQTSNPQQELGEAIDRLLAKNKL
ncbi:MAG: hypothetical protein ABS944_16325 [Solibacillus sp.]|uniref:hypothetical protein n=1 Tax=Solibacillus sp. TaxID=1909654 RepID=UPI003315AC16